MANNNNSLIFGFHAVFARVSHNPDSVNEVYLDKKRKDLRIRKLEKRLMESGVKIVRLDSVSLDQMLPNMAHQGVVASVELERKIKDLDEIILAEDKPQILVALDGVTDPRNLGAIMRSACAFGASAIVVPKDRSVGITDVVEKVASGAAGIMPLITVTNLSRSLRTLKESGFWIIGTDGEANESVRDFEFSSRTVLVFGAEGAGLRRLTRETCDYLVSIPIGDIIESLNVSVSAGICLFEASKSVSRG